MTAKQAGPKDVDAYIAGQPEAVRAVLEKVRATIRRAAPPGAVEAISYGIPTFKLNGSYLVYFAAYKRHVALYPVPQGDEALKTAVAPYVAGKGTLRFPLDKPMPLGLIRTIVKVMIKANQERTKAKGAKA